MINKWFLSLFLLFYNKTEEESIKVNCTPVKLEILNHILNSPNININEDVNVKACRIFLVAHQFLFNDTFPRTSGKHTNPIVGKVSLDISSWTISLEIFLTFFLSNDNSM